MIISLKLPGIDEHGEAGEYGYITASGREYKAGRSPGSAEVQDYAPQLLRAKQFVNSHNLCFTKMIGVVGPEVVELQSNEGREMKTIDRITFDPEVMGGKPCIRGLRVTVGTLVGLIAAGRTRDEILKLYPYLEAEDVAQALAYAAWRAEEIDVPLVFA